MTRNIEGARGLVCCNAPCRVLLHRELSCPPRSPSAARPAPWVRHAHSVRPCATIIMNVAVWPLHKVNRVKRVIVSTYQAVSGAGAWGLYELEQQQKAFGRGEEIRREKFPHQIFNNLFGHNTKIAANGYNEEE